MAVVDRIEFLLMALEVTGKFKGESFRLQKRMNPLHGEVVTAGVMSRSFYSS